MIQKATLSDGGIIFIKGDRGDVADPARSGRVEIREAGRLIETMHDGGELFGEMALIDQEPRSASAVAVGAVDLIVVDKATFDRLVHDLPEFALTVMRLMARRLRAMNAARAVTGTLPISPRRSA